MGEILGRKALSHTCFDELQNSNGSSFWYRQWLLVLQAIKGGNAYQVSYPIHTERQKLSLGPGLNRP
jgi:hypothetical protein